MNSRMVMTPLLYMLLLLMIGCSLDGSNEVNALSTKEDPAIKGTYYTTVIFDKGRAYLNSETRENLKAFTEVAHQDKKPIEEIRILAWSDAEYPDEVKGKSSQEDEQLAAERANNIQQYLKRSLNELSNIDTYNMAKRPNIVGKLFKSDDFRVKESFETTGMTGDKLPDGNISYTKASKAIVIIDYEGKSDDLK